MAQQEIWCWHSRKYGGVGCSIIVSLQSSLEFELGVWILSLELDWTSTGLSLVNFNSRLLCWLQNYKISSKKSGTILVASSDQALKALRLAAISKLYICIGAKRVAPTFPLTTHFRNPIFNERFHVKFKSNYQFDPHPW